MILHLPNAVAAAYFAACMAFGGGVACAMFVTVAYLWRGWK